MLLEPLRQGDIVDVIAPASRCADRELRAAIRELKRLGLKPRVPARLFGKTKIVANTDKERLQQLRKAVFAHDSKLIWCVRGGYGALRLMPEVIRWKKPKHGKIFLGYSDMTTLHAHLNQDWGWPTLHGPLLDRLGRGDMGAKERRQLFELLYGQSAGVEFQNLKPLNAQAKQARRIAAKVLGGNLTVLQSGLGTPSALKPKHAILFLEDTGERPYRVDRMLEQIAQAGWVKQCRAIVFGYFQLNDRTERRQLWSDVIDRFAKVAGVPVLAGLPVGHDKKHQFTLPFNTKAVLTTGREPSLKVSSGIIQS